MNNKIFEALRQYGFEPVSNAVSVGTWRNYAVSLQKFNAKTYYMRWAIRIPKSSRDLAKALRAAVKASGEKGIALNSALQNFVLLTVNFAKAGEQLEVFPRWMNIVADALAQNGIAPADTCAVTGAANPDSLCLVDGFNYQPVCASAVRQKDYDLQSKVEENENNGSYVTGLVGAVLGALVGVAVNLLTIFFLHYVVAYLMALIPVCAMFGYKLFKGKMDKMAIVIVIVLSLLCVPLIMVLELALEAAKELKVSFGEALGWAFRNFTKPQVFDLVKGDILKLLLFMGLGVFVAWGFMSRQLNSSKTGNSKLQMETMRPNPNCQPTQQPTEQPTQQ